MSNNNEQIDNIQSQNESQSDNTQSRNESQSDINESQSENSLTVPYHNYDTLIRPIKKIEFEILSNCMIESSSTLPVNDTRVTIDEFYPSSPTVINVTNFTCENPECAKGYNKKAISAYGMDFCSVPCCRKVVDPIREKERAKEEERIAKNKYLGNLNYGGGAGAR